MRMRRRSKEQDLKPAAPSLEDSLDGMSPSRADAITSLWLMMKRGGLMSAAFLTWRRRFVKIEGQNLVMFSDDGPGADFKGTVPIRGMLVRWLRSLVSHGATLDGEARLMIEAINGDETQPSQVLPHNGDALNMHAFAIDTHRLIGSDVGQLPSHCASLDAAAEPASEAEAHLEATPPGEMSQHHTEHGHTYGAINGRHPDAGGQRATVSQAVSEDGELGEEETESSRISYYDELGNSTSESLGLVYSRKQWSTLFGEQAPAQVWEGRPPKRSSPSPDVDGWASNNGQAPISLPRVSSQRLLCELKKGRAYSAASAASTKNLRLGQPLQTCVVDIGKLTIEAESGVRKASTSRDIRRNSFENGEGDPTAGGSAAASQGGTIKNVRFDTIEKRDDFTTSPSLSSAIDSPGSTRSATTPSSASTPVSRGHAAGKSVIAQQLTKETHLGSGTFGSVYKGTYFNQKVAIKELIVQDLSSESIAEFEREAELHYHLRHSNVILLLCYNVDPSNGPTCMVMELAHCSLFDVLHKGAPLPRPPPDHNELNINTRLHILEDVASGLMFLHTLDIMHLDLKSLNLLLDAAGVVKLADFGLSVVKSEIEGSEGKAIGSLPYMAPELMVDEPVPDKCCDVYSFYVIIWEVTCRQQPHEGRSPAWIMKFASKRKKRLEIPKHIDCPERLEALMIRCAEFEPSRRPTMETCQRAISDVLADPIAPSLLRIQLPEKVLFNCQVIAPTAEILDTPRSKLDYETSCAPASYPSSSSDVSAPTESDNPEDVRPGGLEQRQPVEMSSSDTSVKRSAESGLRQPLRCGDEFLVEAHVVAANGRDDGEDQVYLKLAKEEAYVMAFGPNGENLVKLIDSSVCAEHLAIDARENGIVAVIEALLFQLAILNDEAVLRLLACIFEILAAQETDDSRDAITSASLAGVHMPMSDAMRIKACRRVMASLCTFIHDARVQLAGVSAVVNLALDSVSRDNLVKFGACSAVVAALNTHGKCAFELQRVCVEAILNLLADDANCAGLIKADAMRALLMIIAELTEHARSGAVLRRSRGRRLAARSWTCIARLVSAVPRPKVEKHQTIIDADHVATLLHEYDAAGLCVASAEQATRVVFERNAAKAGCGNDDEEDEDIAMVIIDEAEAASSQPSSADYRFTNTTCDNSDDEGRGAGALLSSLCHTMQRFAAMHTSDEIPPFVDALLDAGAPQVLADVLRCTLENCLTARRFPSCNAFLGADDLARRGCAAVMAIAAASDRARLLLGKAGVCEAIVDIMRKVGRNEKPLQDAEVSRLRYYAIGALSNLAFSAPYNKERLDNAGALRAIAESADVDCDDLEQRRLCCRAFCTLYTVETSSAQDDSQRLEDKHLSVVTRSMLASDDTQLLHLGCAAIINLAAESCHRRALGRVRACEAVTAALTTHPMDARVQEYAFRAAVYLARDDPENRERFLALGIHRLATSAARLFAGNHSVLAWAQRIQNDM